MGGKSTGQRFHVCFHASSEAFPISSSMKLIRTGTSIGANYMEANECVSKKDFQHKIVICKREAKETMYWIELISDECENKDLSRSLWKEAHELLLIFAAIIRK